MSNEVTVGDFHYLIGQMPAKKQWHVLRRLLPLLTTSSSALEQGVKAIRDNSKTIEDLFNAIVPVGKALRELSDEDSDYVMDHCLACCRRKTAGERWVPIVQGSDILFEDISLAQRMELVYHVLMENYSSFFTELLGKLPSVPAS